jgi:hypothetical protein
MKMMDEHNPLGTGVRTRYGLRSVGHDGVYFGYTGFMEWFPARDLTVIYLGNIESGASVSALEDAFTAIATGNKPGPSPQEPPVATADAKKEAEFVGDYKGGPITLRVLDYRGDLLLGAGEGDYPLRPIGRDDFFYPLKYSRVRFTRDAAGKVNGLQWIEGGGGGKYDFARQ